MWRRSLVMACVCVLSCKDRQRAEPAAPEPPPEVLTNASGGLSEESITALVNEQGVLIAVPVQKQGAAALRGRLELKLVDVQQVSEPVVASGGLDFIQSASAQSHAILFAGLGAEWQRAETAGYVIEWRVVLPAGDLYGKKSLYQALGRLEVEVRGTTDIEAGASAPMRVIVRDPRTLLPVSEAAVVGTFTEEAEAAAPIPVFSGQTDAHGELTAQVALPVNVQEGTLRIDVNKDDASAWTDATLRRASDVRIFMSSDKTIYKPGQSVFLRILALAGSQRTPVASTEVIFEVRDGKGNKVFKRIAQTDGFGIGAVEVPTDTRINEGSWKFEAQLAGSKAGLVLPVQNYVLPKLQVALSADEEFALPGETLHGKVAAHYVFGEPVIGGAASVQVRTKSGSFQTTVSGQTDQDGTYSFAVIVPSSLNTAALEEGDALLFTATITDTADQTEQADAAVALSRAPIRITTLAAAPLVTGVQETVFVLITDPVGRPVVADITVTGLTEPLTLQSDSSGVAELAVTAPANLTFEAVDGAARSHTRAVAFGGGAASALRIRSDKAVYQPGETASLEITAPELARMYLDVYRADAGIESLALDVVDGVATTQLDITAGHKGALVLEAYALTGAGSVVRAGHRLFVDPEDRLSISVTSAVESYLPGADATVALEVKDAAGSPQVAAVDLTVVNEASFMLGGEPAGDLHTFYNLAGLPASAAIQGQSVADLVAMPAGAARERLAQLLFAASGAVQGPGVEYNSVRAEMPLVKAALAGKVQRDADAFLLSLAPLVDNDVITWDNAQELVPVLAARETDPFGQKYRAQSGPSDWYNLTLTSGGPDETLETVDDVVHTMYYAWILYGGSYGGGGEEADGDFNMAAEADAGGPAEPAVDARDDATANADGTKVRKDFRETVYVNPALITDALGKAEVSFPLADAITTWRATAQASTATGLLGATRSHFRTFQSFFLDFDLPPLLTQGDVVELPAIIYNYQTTAADVTVSLQTDAGLEVQGSATQTLGLAPSEVRAAKFKVKVVGAGTRTLTLSGSAAGVADALVRTVDVTPKGRPEDVVFSGQLAGSQSYTVNVPADAVMGGTSVVVTVTPGFASEAVSGMEGMLREPGGCFEQTTSSAWPNTLVAGYLEDTGQMTDELRAKTMGMVTRGYQRLLTFESPTGGYNWWGNGCTDPGNRILSAIMLWHTKDLERLIETDSDARDRTLTWLLAQQNSDGSWEAGDALHAGNETLGTDKARATAFITWALAHTGWADAAVADAVAWLKTNLPAEADLYANALVANAFAKSGAVGSGVNTVFDRLDAAKEERDGDRLLWPTTQPSWTGASGDMAAIETTGLVAYALMGAETYLDDAAGAVRFIVANKDRVGTWYNTQATMNALRALSAAASPQGSDVDGVLTIKVGNETAATLILGSENSDVVQTVDLSDYVAAGDSTVSLSFVGTGSPNTRLVRRIYRELAAPAGALLGLTVGYDDTSVSVGSKVKVTALAKNNDTQQRNQVMVRIGRAPGFVPDAADLQGLVQAGKVSRYEVDAASVTFYLMGLAAGESRTLAFRMRAALAVTAKAPASRIYAYYEPDIATETAPIAVVVN